jgi:hypothetical protein
MKTATRIRISSTAAGAGLVALLAIAPLARGGEKAVAPAVLADQSGCVAQGMSVPWQATGIVSARQLVRSCLETSAPSPGLCNNVPPQGMNDVMGIEAWLIRGCANVGGPGYHCQELMAEVAEYCYAQPAGSNSGTVN